MYTFRRGLPMDGLQEYLAIMERWGKARAKLTDDRGGRGKAVANATIQYRTPAGPIEYAAQLRRHFAHEDAGWVAREIAQQTRANQRGLLFAPYVRPIQRETLRALNVDYVDLAGNVHLERRGFEVHVEGRRPARRIDPRAGRAFRRAGLQVVFVLLAVPEAIRLPYRTLARAAGVALRTAHLVVEDLARAGFVAGRGPRRKIVRRRDLVARFVEGYRVELRPNLLVKRLRVQPARREVLLEELQAYFRNRNLAWAVTGGEAAYWMTHLYRGEDLAVFAPASLPDFERTIRCMPDPAGSLQLLNLFCPEVVAEVPDHGPPLAHPLLVYADLEAEGTERAMGVAEAMREHLLKELLSGD